MKNTIIRWVIRGTAVYLVYVAYQGMKQDLTMQEALQIKKQQITLGPDYKLPPEKQKIVDQAQYYWKNHAGREYLLQLRENRQKMKEQLTKLIHEQKNNYQKMKKEGSDKRELAKMQHQLTLLSAYRKKFEKPPPLVEKFQKQKSNTQQGQQIDYFQKEQ